MLFWHFSVITPTLLPTPSFSVQKCHSHYFSMNEKQSNQASIIIQDMWLKMLYWRHIGHQTEYARPFLSGLYVIFVCLFNGVYLPSSGYQFYRMQNSWGGVPQDLKHTVAV